ncbi:glycoside hydrolase family 43 protein [Mariniflexile sp.]|uniref:glycoside hydrolase family 43 protein n=1 Tax=Mariniflexile sp. TaxID=1979402 RepID=UPI0040482511
MKKKLKKISINYYLVFSLLGIVSTSCISCGNGSDAVDKEEQQIDVEPPITTTTFRNPVLDSGPDPWVFKNGDEYFVTFTTGNNITLVRTNKMSDLKNGTKKVIWIPPAGGMNSKEIWAPELHKINGAWYVYYAASNGDNNTHRMWVLENTSTDPFQGVWLDKGELKLPDDKWAIDGSPFEFNGKYYFAWSGWEGDNNVRQDIYIAEMENPLSIVGQRVNILKPENAWETNGTNPEVTEGPEFFLKNDKVFIFYSAGACWKDGYSIGAIYMDINSNPKEVNSWKRLPNNPLFVSNNTGNAFGPGHNSFFKSLDGQEDWILYHANPQPGQGCGGNRSVRMQKFSWDSNGFPLLGSPEPLNKDILKPSGE